MFVTTKMKAAMVIGFGLISGAGATATETKFEIPVKVTLATISQTTGTLYVSIQTREQYMGIKGRGGVIKTLTPGQMDLSYSVDSPGEYAVSVWHDINDDGVFSMDENYRILDGWGASGTPPKDRKPVFDDVKITIPQNGTVVPIEVNYPL